MKTVFTSAFQEKALVALSLLRSAGIEGHVMADNMLNMNPLFSIDVGNFNVVVADEDETDALALLRDYR